MRSQGANGRSQNGAAGKSVKPDIETTYRGRQVAGLLIVGVLMVVFAVIRANLHEAFPPGWWNVW